MHLVRTLRAKNPEGFSTQRPKAEEPFNTVVVYYRPERCQLLIYSKIFDSTKLVVRQLDRSIPYQCDCLPICSEKQQEEY